MKKGSHNSLTYLPPKHWYLKPFNFMAKCQSVNYEKQYQLGSRIFDIRIRYDNNLNIVFAHGSMEYKSFTEKDLYDMLTYLNSKSTTDDRIWVRFLLERNSELKDKNKQTLEQDKFCKLCQIVKMLNQNILFFGGRRKYDWALLYDFQCGEPNMIDLYSSTTGTKIDDLYKEVLILKNKIVILRNR